MKILKIFQVNRKKVIIIIISMTILVFLIIKYIHPFITNYLLNSINYSYSPIPEHKYHNNYKVKIPYNIVPLVPNQIGSKIKEYNQLYKQESNDNADNLEYLDYNRLFKNNDFDDLIVSIDDHECVLSLTVSKVYSNLDSLNLKSDVLQKFNTLKKFYGKKYLVYKSKDQQYIYIKWENENYYILLFFTNYKFHNNKDLRYYYSISFNKMHAKIYQDDQEHLENYFKEINNEYLKILGF